MDLSSLTSVIFNDVVNDTQVCYHLVYPKNLNLIKRQKRVSQISGQSTAKKRKRRGRPRKEEIKASEEGRRVPEETLNDVKPDENAVQLTCSRTRYGRLSRPPKHMSKFVDIKETKVSTPTDVNSIPLEVHEVQSNVQTEIVKSPEAVPRKIRKNVDRFTCTGCKKVNCHRQ